MATEAAALPGPPAMEGGRRQPPVLPERPLVRQALACASPAICLALAMLLPFLGKAYTIDDVTFLLQARHLLTDPFHPTAFDMVFHGERIRLSRDLVTGPVMAYLLVPTMLLDGAEWVAHTIQAGLLACGVYFTTALGLRLGQDRTQATLAGLLVAASPAVLAMTATAMPDLPAMVFAVAGMERLTAAKQDRSSFAAVIGAILLGIAALSRPHALLLFPCAALFLLDPGTLRSGARGLVRQWLTPPIATLAIGLVVWGAVIVLTRDPLSNATVAGTSLRRLESSKIALNLGSFLLYWSVAFPLTILWPVLRGGAFLDTRRTLLTFATGLVLAAAGQFFQFGPGYGLLSLVLIGYGLDVVADIILLAWRNRDERALALALWLLIGAATAVYVHLPAKVLVPSAPAMALLLSGQLGIATRGRRVMTTVGATLVACFVLGVLIMRADAALAEVGREGGKLVASYRANGNQVWFDGGWGFQWYSMKAGGKALATTPPFPHDGDVVVAGPTARLVRQSYPHRVLLYQRIFDAPGGRLFREGAGFYANDSGPLAWTWGTSEIGRIEAWRIGFPPPPP